MTCALPAMTQGLVKATRTMRSPQGEAVVACSVGQRTGPLRALFFLGRLIMGKSAGQCFGMRSATILKGVGNHDGEGGIVNRQSRRRAQNRTGQRLGMGEAKMSIRIHELK